MTKPKRLHIHSSLWGNLYRHRYYVDGVRIRKDIFNSLLKQHFPAQEGKHTKLSSSMHRTTWEKINGNNA